METNNSANEARGFYKLNWLQRIGFGSGDLAQNLIFQTVACYLMIYLTTVLKLNPAFVSGLILTVRLIDCFWSPVVGRYIDNRNPKLGKYRTYLLYGGIPLTVVCLPVDASAGCHLVHDHEVNLCHSQLYRAEHDLLRGQHPIRFHHGQYDP